MTGVPRAAHIHSHTGTLPILIIIGMGRRGVRGTPSSMERHPWEGCWIWAQLPLSIWGYGGPHIDTPTGYRGGALHHRHYQGVTNMGSSNVPHVSCDGANISKTHLTPTYHRW